MTGRPRADTSYRSKGLFTLISVLAILLAAPLVVVVTSPLHRSAPEWAHVRDSILPAYGGETLVLLAGVLVVGLLIALPSAWLIASFQFPLRGMFRWALVLPLALPTYISAYAYAGLLGPTGAFTRWSVSHGGPRTDIVNLPGLCAVLALVLFPYIYLPTRAAFAQGMSTQLEAACLLGSRAMRRFIRIALPLARPAIAGGALLLCMETLNDFGAVKYYGVRTLTTGIFRSWGGLYDMGSALRLCIALLGLIALLLWIERRGRARARQTTDQVQGVRARLTGVRAWMATAWCLLVLSLSVGLPVGRIISDVIATMDRPVWSEVFAAFGNTLYVAALAAALTMGIALLFTYRERYGKRSNVAIRIANLGYAIPGAVIAVAVMAVAGAIDRQGWMGFALIGSIGLLTYAFAVRFLAVGTQPLYGNLRQQSVALDEAARLLGASPWRSFLRINLPLLKPALLAAALLVSIDVIKELPLTLVLRPFNFQTLSTKAYELASIEQLREASWPALLIVLCGTIPVLLLEKLLARPT
ncbi:MAG: iron ABC transporter permease, partial [Flavobacteriales bacterium]